MSKYQKRVNKRLRARYDSAVRGGNWTEAYRLAKIIIRNDSADNKSQKIEKNVRKLLDIGKEKCYNIYAGKGRMDAEEPASWITTEGGHHVPLDDEGKALAGGGGTLKGKDFSEAKSENTEEKSLSGSGSKDTEKVNGASGQKTVIKQKSKIKNFGSTNTSDSRGDDSLAKHTDSNGNISSEREVLHQTIVDNLFKDATPVNGQATFTMMGGGSASGKSHMINSGAVTLPENSVMVDSDAIKKELPEYQEMLASGQIDEAAAYVHEESSALAKRCLGIANSEGYNVTLDGTGDGSVKSLSKKIDDAHKAGMVVNGVYATVPIETALERSQARAEKTGRKVPEDTIINTHKAVSSVLPQCAHKFDSVQLYDTSGKIPILIATGGSGKGLTAVKGREKEFKAFLDKANY